jgi:hypothetical protein
MSPTSPEGPSIPAALVEDFAGDIEDQIANLEDVADNVTEQIERANEVAAAVLGLVASMRREAAHARGGKGT